MPKSRVLLWRQLHTVDAEQIYERWTTNPDGHIDDRLIGDDRVTGGGDTFVWTVRTRAELVRLVGALHHYNGDSALWFRGERDRFRQALPARMRGDDKALFLAIRKWLQTVSGRDRVLRDRGALARLAILQHYFCPTSLLDVTSNLDIATRFACEKKQGARDKPKDPHLRVYATPRPIAAVSVFEQADVCLVDLRAELPSYCLRPHWQHAAFIARCAAVAADTRGEQVVDEVDGQVDSLCIGWIRLALGARPTGEISERDLYPSASEVCTACRAERDCDMNGDYLWHLLGCLSDDVFSPHFPGPG